jgi:hypothetical protein
VGAFRALDTREWYVKYDLRAGHAHGRGLYLKKGISSNNLALEQLFGFGRLASGNDAERLLVFWTQADLRSPGGKVA